MIAVEQTGQDPFFWNPQINHTECPKINGTCTIIIETGFIIVSFDELWEIVIGRLNRNFRRVYTLTTDKIQEFFDMIQNMLKNDNEFDFTLFNIDLCRLATK